MRNQAQAQERRTQSAREFASCTQKANVQAETQKISKRRQYWEYMIHSLHRSNWIIRARARYWWHFCAQLA